MGRINVRYYKAHPPEKERQLSPAAYFMWHSMTPEQHEAIIQWSKDMNKTLLNLGNAIHTALLKTFKEIYHIPSKEVER